MLINPALGRLRLKDSEFETSMGWTQKKEKKCEL
jgi:hypothetical protein